MTADDGIVDDGMIFYEWTEAMTNAGVSPEDFREIIHAIVCTTHDTCATKVAPQDAIGLMMIAALTVVFGHSKLSREEVFTLADSALAMAKRAFNGDDPRNRIMN